MTHEILLPMVRQYRHNNSDGFVFGYDKEGTDRAVAALFAKQKELEDALYRLVGVPERLLRGQPIRALDETLAHCNKALETDALLHAIFSRDGYIRFYSSLDFEIQIYGKGVEVKNDGELYRFVEVS